MCGGTAVCVCVCLLCNVQLTNEFQVAHLPQMIKHLNVNKCNACLSSYKFDYFFSDIFYALSQEVHESIIYCMLHFVCTPLQFVPITRKKKS